MIAQNAREQEPEKSPARELSLAYPEAYARRDSAIPYMEEIHEMAVTGKSRISAMGTRMPMPDWKDILILGAQLNPMPLDEHAPVDTVTVIGKHARKPMVLEHPVYIPICPSELCPGRQRLPWLGEAMP